MIYKQKIMLDISGMEAYRCHRSIRADQDDNLTRKIEATILVDGIKYAVPASAKVEFRASKPDGTFIVAPVVVNDDGTILIDLDEQLLAVPGIITAKIVISEDGGDDRISTASFTIQVEEAPEGEAIESSNVFLELRFAIKKAEDAANRTDKFIEEYDKRLNEKQPKGNYLLRSDVLSEDNSVVIQALIDTDLLTAVRDKTGILSDENGNILMW